MSKFDHDSYKSAWELTINLLGTIAAKELSEKEALAAVLVATMQATYTIAKTEEQADELFLIARAEAEENYHNQK